MEDLQITELFFSRDANGLKEAQNKYSSYLFTAARGILKDSRDCEEAVSDAFRKAWNAIPPDRPERLGAYLAKIVRRTALDLVRRQTSAKRAADTYALSYEELSECLPSFSDPAKSVESGELTGLLNRFLRSLDGEKRRVFVLRYFYFLSLEEISARTGMSVPKLKSLLMRLRNRLKEDLEKEGYR